MDDENPFGYVKSEWVDDTISLSDDSHLSSTSLLGTLIGQSSSEESFYTLRITQEEKYEAARQSLRDSIAYVRQAEGVKAEGLKIDYEEQRKKDKEREYHELVIPTMSDSLRETIHKRYSSHMLSQEDLVMPLMSQLGMKQEVPAWKRRPTGMVAELMEYLARHRESIEERERKRRKTA